VIAAAVLHAEPDVVQHNHVLGLIYAALAAVCVLALATRAAAAWLCSLPLTASHVAFLLLMLLLFVVRAVSGFWEPSADVVKGGAGSILYNLVNTGPLIVFLTIFLVMIYHVTRVLHSIHIAFESTLHSIGGELTPSSPRGKLTCVSCQGMAFLKALKCALIALSTLMWLSAGVAYGISPLTGDNDTWRRVFACTLEMPFFCMSLITGACFLVASVILLRRLRRLQRLLHSSLDEDSRERGSAAALPARRNGNSTLASGTTSGCYAEAPPMAPGAPVFGSPCIIDEAGARSTGTPASATRSLRVANQPSAFSLNSAATPDVSPVLSCLRRILIVVSICMAAFLYRAVCIFLILLRWKNPVWPAGMMMPYYLISEVMPVSVLLFLYLLPGLEALCFACGGARRGMQVSLLEDHPGPGSRAASTSSYPSRVAIP